MNPLSTSRMPAALAVASYSTSSQRVLLAAWLLLAAGLASSSHAAAPVASTGTGLTTAAIPARKISLKQTGKPKASKVPPRVAPAPAKKVVAPPAATPLVRAQAATQPVALAPPATRTQAGRVLDEAGQPLVGATIMLQGSTKGTSTDANGSYSLEVPSGENTFIFGYGGYEDEVVKCHDGQPLTVTLLPTPGKDKMRKKRR
ncbi:hypothetical protein GO988_04355 [Hymenobacter sp. HMF4947]|uniref:Carboxypeptidase-like regulatory domain-containing protein n=1 Tax=Hymenobacter ginkgonis TaxID=2682976 RepID=A0A7K1TBJ3_9BACT|nr:carboxypeptidase-like regulatory domain-containing protein [Hymenobacter ginkgonis]MVN75551.1 hypothetical protein [Hymenobacter ginkgonis]